MLIFFIYIYSNSINMSSSEENTDYSESEYDVDLNDNDTSGDEFTGGFVLSATAVDGPQAPGDMRPQLPISSLPNLNNGTTPRGLSGAPVANNVVPTTLYALRNEIDAIAQVYWGTAQKFNTLKQECSKLSDTTLNASLNAIGEAMETLHTEIDRVHGELERLKN